MSSWTLGHCGAQGSGLGIASLSSFTRGFWPIACPIDRRNKSWRWDWEVNVCADKKQSGGAVRWGKREDTEPSGEISSYLQQMEDWMDG